MLAVRDALPDLLGLSVDDERACVEALTRLPDWLLDSELVLEEPPCELCGRGHDDAGCPVLAPARTEAPAGSVAGSVNGSVAGSVGAELTGFWAVPGVTGLDTPTTPVLPSVGQLVGQVVTLVEQIAAVDVTSLEPGRALGEAEALTGIQHTVRQALLGRTQDVHERKLYQHLGYRSTAAWQRDTAPDTPRSERTLSRRLGTLPWLRDALRERQVSFTAAHQLGKALADLRPHLDTPDGLIDGRPGEQVLTGVLSGALDLLCQHHGGLDPNDPHQAALLARLDAQLGAIALSPTSQLDRLEQLLVLLATELPARDLPAVLEHLRLQLLPEILEMQDREAQHKRHLSLKPNTDGTWDLRATLTPETGEQLFTAIRSEARRDPANPLDTHARETARHAANEAASLTDSAASDAARTDAARTDAARTDAARTDAAPAEGEPAADLAAELVINPSGDPIPDPSGDPAGPVVFSVFTGERAGEFDEVLSGLLVETDPWAARPLDAPEPEPVRPRGRGQRLHDAFGLLLTRYLSTGLGGTSNKIPVQISTIITERTVTGAPGAPPARGGSGRPLARSLVQRWWCDAHVTALLMSTGWTPLGVVHQQRNVTGVEMKALTAQHDQRCPGIGCCTSTPNPLTPLVPHHLDRYSTTGTTQLSRMLLCCEVLHQDIHLGKRLIRLRDGSHISEDGYLHDPT